MNRFLECYDMFCQSWNYQPSESILLNFKTLVDNLIEEVGDQRFISVINWELFQQLCKDIDAQFDVIL